MRAARVLSAIALARRRTCRLRPADMPRPRRRKPLTRPAMFLHGVGVAFWLGALAPLVALLWSRKGAALPVVQRFSRVAIPVVGVLALTGLALAIIQLESFGALVTTRYGIILSIKLVLVAALLGLAALNRFRLTPALADASATQPLSRSILLECAVAARHSLRRRRLALHAAAALAASPMRRSPSTSTPTRRCSRCWSRRAGWGRTISCCSS